MTPSVNRIKLSQNIMDSVCHSKKKLHYDPLSLNRTYHSTSSIPILDSYTFKNNVKLALRFQTTQLSLVSSRTFESTGKSTYHLDGASFLHSSMSSSMECP